MFALDRNRSWRATRNARAPMAQVRIDECIYECIYKKCWLGRAMYEWDEAKNQANIAKHGVSFEQAVQIFEGPVVTVEDNGPGHGEIREISVGVASGVRYLTVVHTDRSGVTRLISARRATPRERRVYDAEIKGG
jgi:uncharacterized protein